MKGCCILSIFYRRTRSARWGVIVCHCGNSMVCRDGEWRLWNG